jgi:hypothetical protein
MLMGTTPDFVITSSELPVNDWSVPRTPGSGGAVLISAHIAFGVAATANKEKHTRYNNGYFVKIFFQPPELRSVAV